MMDHSGSMRSIVPFVLVGLMATWSPPAAHATFPGLSGRIAFSSTGVAATNPEGDPEIYTMEPDGTDVRQLTSNASDDFSPAWSPDGKKIAFSSKRDGDYEIFVMNADGTSPVNLTNNTAYDQSPVWSPAGTKIAFESERDGATNREIYVMGANGSAPTNLTNTAGYDGVPAWSPDGTRIAWERGGFQVWTMAANGMRSASCE